MAFYRLYAEHVRNRPELVAALQERFDVRLAFADDVFDSFYTVVINGTAAQADQARDIVWRYNGGTYCNLSEITEDQYDEMC